MQPHTKQWTRWRASIDHTRRTKELIKRSVFKETAERETGTAARSVIARIIRTVLGAVRVASTIVGSGVAGTAIIVMGFVIGRFVCAAAGVVDLSFVLCVCD